jgi:hypothetical protein
MAKAYDRIEWQFLEQTLLTMGFPINLVSTIMSCVSTVSFSILIDGTLPQFQTPQRYQTRGSSIPLPLYSLC